jgi:hypothetical protein
MSFLGLSVSSDLSGRVVDGVLSVWGGRGGPEGAGHVRTFGVERLEFDSACELIGERYER